MTRFFNVKKGVNSLSQIKNGIYRNIKPSKQLLVFFCLKILNNMMIFLIQIFTQK